MEITRISIYTLSQMWVNGTWKKNIKNGEVREKLDVLLKKLSNIKLTP